MKKINITALSLAALLSCTAAHARDTTHLFSIEEALSTPAAQEKLNKGVKFYFGETAPKAATHLGTHVSNRKTNAFNKTDKEACEWVFLSSLLALQDRAIKDGGNAVINIHSFYKKKARHSDKEYECHAGAFVAGTALKGDVVKLD